MKSRNIMKKKGIIFLFALSFLITIPSFANVSLKNGNFFIGYTDMVYPGGFEPKIDRVYNSKTDFEGMFGYGWGSEYEVKIEVAADGSVVIHEYGGGANNRFVPIDFSPKQLKKSVDKIVKTAKEMGKVSNTSQVKKYRQKLMKNSIFRNDEWQHFVGLGKLEPVKVEKGSKFISQQFSYQYLTKVEDGFIRVFDNGKREYFNDQGQLVRVQDTNDNYIKFAYDDSGHLKKLKDNFNRKMFFEFNSKGLLKKVKGLNDKTAQYKYDDEERLAVSKDSEGNIYKYEYDSNNNMVKVTYPDDSEMKISYYKDNKYKSVKKIVDREGLVTKYDYDWDKIDDGELKVAVKVEDSEGDVLSERKYQYFFKYKNSGEEWTYRLVTEIDGDKTDKIYHEECGIPKVIKKEEGKTEFKYDQKCRVTYKETPTQKVQLKYDEDAGKVSAVQRQYKGTDEKSWSQFKYDDKGNLKKAVNSEDKKVSLFYDRFGRISTMVDQDKNKIRFSYNENSKPIKIKHSKLGTITVSYTNSGEISDVSSQGGRSVASKVTGAFQNLLDIIRPAGVSLSF